MRKVLVLLMAACMSLACPAEATSSVVAEGFYEAHYGDQIPPTRHDSVLVFDGEDYLGQVQVLVVRRPGREVNPGDIRVSLYDSEHRLRAVLHP